jgi:hypothetical protein
MKILAYISLGLLCILFITGSVRGLFYYPNDTDLLLSVFSKVFLVWIISALILWVFGFIDIFRMWAIRGAVKSLTFLILLLTLNVFFAYYLFTRKGLSRG